MRTHLPAIGLLLPFLLALPACSTAPSPRPVIETRTEYLRPPAISECIRPKLPPLRMNDDMAAALTAFMRAWDECASKVTTQVDWQKKHAGNSAEQVGKFAE